uniref:Uncharacterized protein n=1 Tax=Rhizophora mucronata TaxID=61149 RepID=A0A2P2MWV9_RHIMU
MKFAVACCSKESQNLIVDKAHGVLSSTTSLMQKGSLCTVPGQVEGLMPSLAWSSLRNKLNLKSNGPERSVGCNFDEAVDMILSTNECRSFDSNPSGRTSTGNEISLTNICQDATNSRLLQNNVIVGLAWIGKGLPM